MSKLVHADEFVVGACQQAKPERSYQSAKNKAVVAIELSEKQQVKRVYIKAIDDYSAQVLTPIFEEHISKLAKIVTDQWKGYTPLTKMYDIEQIPSKKGKSFKQLHIIVHLVKSWLRTIPTHISGWHAPHYFNEFCYRINRSANKETIFHNTVERMLKNNHYLMLY